LDNPIYNPADQIEMGAARFGELIDIVAGYVPNAHRRSCATRSLRGHLRGWRSAADPRSTSPAVKFGGIAEYCATAVSANPF
jgi:hypothetical protein